MGHFGHSKISQRVTAVVGRGLRRRSAFAVSCFWNTKRDDGDKKITGQRHRARRPARLVQPALAYPGNAYRPSDLPDFPDNSQPEPLKPSVSRFIGPLEIDCRPIFTLETVAAGFQNAFLGERFDTPLDHASQWRFRPRPFLIFDP